MENFYLTVGIGIGSSITAAVLSFVASVIYNKLWYINKYGFLAGSYLGFGYEKESPEWKVKEKCQSKAEIKYYRKNILEITVTNLEKKLDYKWVGKIYMESENHGSVSWRYKYFKSQKFGDKHHKYGFKNVIVAQDETNVYFYLSPEPNDGFNKEIFIKKQLPRVLKEGTSPSSIGFWLLSFSSIIYQFNFISFVPYTQCRYMDFN